MAMQGDNRRTMRLTPTMNTLLIGARGSGKSTVGRLLADQLQQPFVDLDEITLARLNLPTVTAVWQELGEQAWREAEIESLRDVLAGQGQVIALGGGTPVIPLGRELIQQAVAAERSCVIYLRYPPAVLQTRLQRTPGDRPSLTGDTPADEISKILAAREPVYLQLAQITIDCGDDDATPATIALHLAELLRSGYVIGSHLTIQQLQQEKR